MEKHLFCPIGKSAETLIFCEANLTALARPLVFQWLEERDRSAWSYPPGRLDVILDEEEAEILYRGLSEMLGIEGYGSLDEIAFHGIVGNYETIMWLIVLYFLRAETDRCDMGEILRSDCIITLDKVIDSVFSSCDPKTRCTDWDRVFAPYSNFSRKDVSRDKPFMSQVYDVLTNATNPIFSAILEHVMHIFEEGALSIL